MRVPRCIVGLTIVALVLTGMPISIGSSVVVAASPPLGPIVTPWKAAVQGASSHAAKLDIAYGRLPLAFEPNLGQTRPGVLFLAHGADLLGYPGVGALDLTAAGSLVVPAAQSVSAHGQPVPKSASTALSLSPLLANPHPVVEALDRLPGTASYMIGADQSTWLRGIPLYGRIRYRDIYPGIDLEYRGQGGTLTYRFVVHPSADLQLIHLAFTETQAGTQDTPVLGGGVSPVLEETPLVYQQTADGRWAPAGHAALQVDGTRTGGQLSLAPAAYDRQRALAIDSVLDFGTYLGGTGDDSVNAVASDVSGGTYLAGTTEAADFPVTHAAFLQRYPGQSTNDEGFISGTDEAFVAHLNAAGTALLFATYLGGTDKNYTTATSLAEDQDGSVAVAGYTGSADFPTTTGALMRHLPTTGNAQFSAFVAHLSAAGTNLLAATYVGVGTDISPFVSATLNVLVGVDARDDIIVAGTTNSAHIPTTANALQPRIPSHLAQYDDTSGFILKLNAAATTLLYGTYLGGSTADAINGLSVDAAGKSTVVGITSPDFPVTMSAAQPRFPTDVNHFAGFVAQLNEAGTSLIYATYLGGSKDTAGNGVVVDDKGNAYVTGATTSTNFPVHGGFQSRSGGGQDAFVMGLDSLGRIRFASYLGGNLDDSGVALAAAGDGTLYVTGTIVTDNPETLVYHKSTTFPVSKDAVQRTYQKNIASCDGYDNDQSEECEDYNVGRQVIFLARVAPGGHALTYSTLLSGSMNDNVTGLTVDTRNRVSLVGSTSSENFPLHNPLMKRIDPPYYDDLYSGDSSDPPNLPPLDGFVLRIAFA